MLKIHDYIYIILKIIVIIAALSWGLMAIDKNYNLVEMMGSLLPTEYNESFQKTTYIVFALSAVYIMLQRKTFLPFLDVTIAPLNRFLKELLKVIFAAISYILSAIHNPPILFLQS